MEKKKGFGIFYDIFCAESGPSADDGSELIGWVETEKEALQFVEEGRNWPYPNHHRYEPMECPGKLLQEVFQEE
jgi:hypothetical protein